MWFRRDLRLADHPALIAAGADGAEVVPVFIIDPTFAASGAPRLAYLHDCLSSLDAEIRRRSGTGLVIRHGDPADVWAAAEMVYLAAQLAKADPLRSSHEPTSRKEKRS